MASSIIITRRAFHGVVRYGQNTFAAFSSSSSSLGRNIGIMRAGTNTIWDSEHHHPRRQQQHHQHHHQQQQIRSMFIQTNETPNPESIKFLPGRVVIDENVSENGGSGSEAGGGFYVTRGEKLEISRSPLAKYLFAVDGVKSIYLGSDFITVTKYAENPWNHVRVEVFSAIMDFYASGQPALSSVPQVTDTTIFEDDSEVVALIKEILETRIRPAVQEDGGDIRYVDFDEESGIVSVKLAGSCVGCPSSSVTLKNGVENMLMHYIEEVTGVESLEDEENDDESTNHDDDDDIINKEENQEAQKKVKSYEERLAAAGIPFSD